MRLTFTFYSICLGLIFFLTFSAKGQGTGTLDGPHLATAGGYEYLTYLPKNYSGSTPLLLYLHGGEGILNGEDGFSDFSNFKNGLPPIIHQMINSPGTNLTGQAENFILVVPHLPRDEATYPKHNDQLWDIEKVAAVMSDAVTRYNVEWSNLQRNNIFMSGISLGAKGVWDYVLADPDLDFPGVADFIKPSAIVPIGGNGFPGDICEAQDIAIWALHGAQDTQVEPNGVNDQGRSGSKLMIDAYDNCLDKIKPGRLTLMDGVGHTNWNQYYDGTTGYNIYEWLMLHGDELIANIPPLINVDYLTKTIDISNNNFISDLGVAYDPEGEDLVVGWTLLNNNEDVEIFDTGDPSKLYAEFNAPGTYNFRFSASDGVNPVHKDITIEVLSEVTIQRAPVDFYLHDITDNDNEHDILKLSNRQRINSEDYAGKKITIRAESINAPQSLRFTLNENRNYRTANSDLLNDRNPRDIWTLETGENIISVTAYNNRNPSTDPAVTLSYAIYVDGDPVILPVEFLNVSAKREMDKITVSWATASEEGNDFFTIERSSAGDTFETIGTVDGAGDSKTVKKYTFTDHNPPGDKAFYRIKQTDFDGKSDYSKIVSVAGSNQFQVSLFPNPSDRGLVYLRLSSSDFYTEVKVQLFDAIGNHYFSDSFSPEALFKEEGYLLSKTKSLKAGMYFVIISQGENKVQRKLVVK